jgi:hypothetical protein
MRLEFPKRGETFFDAALPTRPPYKGYKTVWDKMDEMIQ